MRRILLIYHGWGIGGGLIAMIGLIHQLKRQYDVFIIVMQLITLKMREFQLRS